jgi:hypothetical protein
MADISLIPKAQKQRGLPHFASFQEPAEKLPLAMRVVLLLWGLAILAGAGLWAWQWSLKGTQEALSQELLSVRQARDIEQENKVQRLSRELLSFDSLLAQHQNWTRFFDLVEDRTVPNIAFKEFEASLAEGNFSMTGTGPTYNALARQIRAFEQDERVRKVDVTDIKLDEDGRVEFKLMLTIDPGMLQGVPEQVAP